MVPNSTPAAVLGATVALTTLSSLAVVLRFVARQRQKLRPMADDWLCLAALV